MTSFKMADGIAWLIVGVLTWLYVRNLESCQVLLRRRGGHFEWKIASSCGRNGTTRGWCQPSSAPSRGRAYVCSSCATASSKHRVTLFTGPTWTAFGVKTTINAPGTWVTIWNTYRWQMKTVTCFVVRSLTLSRSEKQNKHDRLWNHNCVLSQPRHLETKFDAESANPDVQFFIGLGNGWRSNRRQSII